MKHLVGPVPIANIEHQARSGEAMSDLYAPHRRFIELRKHKRVTLPAGSLLSFSAVSGPHKVEGEVEGDGSILNLSPGGCKVVSGVEVKIGQHYQLIIQLPSVPAPITVDSAVVRWVHTDEFGVKILCMAPDQEERLLELFHRLRSAAA